MTKPTIMKIWIAGLIVLAAGLLIGGVCLGMLLAYGGHFTPAANGNGYDFVPTINTYFWTMVSLTSVGVVIAAMGGIVQLTAWIGALINTYQLADKTWFYVLLIGGIVGLGATLVGFAAMVAYLVAGSDGMAQRQPQVEQSQTRAPTFAPTV